jgi:hypothetical protein
MRRRRGWSWGRTATATRVGGEEGGEGGQEKTGKKGTEGTREDLAYLPPSSELCDEKDALRGVNNLKSHRGTEERDHNARHGEQGGPRCTYLKQLNNITMTNTLQNFDLS